jgi:hypothetical protein
MTEPSTQQGNGGPRDRGATVVVADKQTTGTNFITATTSASVAVIIITIIGSIDRYRRVAAAVRHRS